MLIEINGSSGGTNYWKRRDPIVFGVKSNISFCLHRMLASCSFLVKDNEKKDEDEWNQLLKLYLQILFGVGVVRNYEVGTDNIEKSEEKNEGEEKLHISNE
uniref:Uncharacterized protein n=1 Tax=Pristionchus pacificus TaxID=54126 RepID=A0A2A6CW41_PRIPA|eukprot:PDM82231.1 hypothetical protein PRIPAC_36624 [Pristionchus pacificus]